MTENKADPSQKATLRTLPRNVWAVSLTSFFMDISSEMVINVLPLFLANVMGLKTNVIGVIEGVAEATASLLKVFSGWLSDKLRARKWLAVTGYGLSALAKPFFYFANVWAVAGARWADRVGKGIRTAPRDALVADSIDEQNRGLAFGIGPKSRPLHDTMKTNRIEDWLSASTAPRIPAGPCWDCSSHWVWCG